MAAQGIAVGFGIAVAALSLAASAHPQLTAAPLPLGDGKISREPVAGSVVACNARFPGGGGAHRTGTWVRDGFWYPAEKPTVQGADTWSPELAIRREGPWRVIRTNGLPAHATGHFPITPGTPAFAYDRNPNRLQAREVELRLPADPVITDTANCVPMGLIGVTVTGVALFNAFDLHGRDAAAYEIQDVCAGHPERSGRYHYHTWSPCMVPANHPADAPVGWMIDGVPILGPRFADGRLVTNADLDACHGRHGPVLVDGRVEERYHYRFTAEYPYTVGCFRGAPPAAQR